MSDGLSIAASAINAATTEIAVTSENIANAQTPGYAAQRTELAAQPGGGPLGIGSGVTVTSVAQVTNALLSANSLQAQGSLQSLTASQQVLTGIENVFPLGQSSAAAASSTTGSSNTSIAGQLANFWSSWDAIAQNPSGTAPRTQVIDQAQGLVTSLNEASTQLGQLATNTVNQLQGQVGQVNALLDQAAQLNGQILTTTGGGGSPNQLVDQLNSVTGQLSQLAGVSVQTQQDGTAFVSINGIGLVQGGTATQLQLSGTGTGGVTSASVTTVGGTPVSVTSGSMAGLLNGVNSVIPQYQGDLNQVASNLANIVNTQLGYGYTATGSSNGAPLFTVNGGSTTTPETPTTPISVTAATISVNGAISANPALIAAAGSSAAAANDGSNAQTMAELSTQSSVAFPPPPSTSVASFTLPDVAYQQLVEGIGAATQSVNTQVAAQTSVANQAQQALQSATGVNQNTELTNLMQYQAAYQASAKLVTVIATTIQSLLQAV